MEDSVRKAFEGFELPVTDMDWSRIEAALPVEDKRKGFFFWFNKHKGLSLLLLCAAGILGSGAYYFASQHTNSQAFVSKSEPSEVAKATENLSTQDVPAKNQLPAAGATQKNATPQTGIAPAKSGTAASTGSSSVPTQTRVSNSESTPAERPAVAKTPATMPTPTAAQPPVVAEEPPTFPTFASLGFGIHKFITPVLGLFKLPLSIRLHKSTDPAIPPLTPQFYASLGLSQAPGKMTPKTGSAIWENYQWLGGANPATDLRLEGGMTVGQKWQFHAGAAFEGNPAQSSSSDSIKIRIADRFLPYMDVNGNVLYWLAVRWRDSVVVINRNPQKVWMEIPLGLSRSFDLNNDWKFRAGLTVNPGVMLGGTGQIANPYAQYSGSYLKYQYGIEADTAAAVIQARPFMNSYRIGAGLQLGAEKTMAPYTLGVYLQTRYYSPIWKKETALSQNSLQYGLNIRLGISLNP
jgi:hypothetical protein